MKTAKLTSAILLATIASVGFSSCSKDDKDEPMPKPSVEKRLTKASIPWSDLYRNTYEPTYNTNGQIQSSKISSEWLYDGDVSHYTESFTYSGDKIEANTNFWHDYNGTYYLSNGLITKYVDESGNESTFQYDGRHLTQFTNEYGDKRVYKWDNNDIVSTYEIDSEDGTSRHAYTYEYYSEYDFGGICVFLDSNSYPYDDIHPLLAIQGFFGDLPVHMLKRIIEDNEVDCDFTYFYDNEGFPVATDYKLAGNPNTFKQSFAWENVK